jgi:putative DNA primase/helicase
VKLYYLAQPPSGTLVERYLRNRGIELTGDILRADAIRFAPQCGFRLANDTLIYLPAMVALYRDILTDRPRALHRTALRADGSDRIRAGEIEGLTKGRRALASTHGSAIKLCRDLGVGGAGARTWRRH